MLKQLTKQIALQASAVRARTCRGRGILVCSAPVPERNRGDQALLWAVLHELGRRNAGPLTVLTTSNQPVETVKESVSLRIRSDLFSLFLTRRSFREELGFIRECGRHRSLVMIGADVLDEGYSVERSMASLHALARADRVGLATRILGFSVNGPPSGGLCERLVRLGGRTRLFIRDPESYKRLHEAGIPGIEPAGDLAFLLEPASVDEIPAGLSDFIAAHSGSLIGLNLTKVVMDMYGREQERLGIVAEACGVLAREDGLRFLLIPHDEPEGEEYLRRVGTMIHGKARDVFRVVTPLPHCRVLKRIAGQCMHVFTCRLHLGIATLGMGRPVTGFPYQGKFEGQFDLFGLSHEGLIDAKRFPCSVDEMVALMRRRIAQSEELATQIQSRLPRIRELSMRNFDGLGEQTEEQMG